MTTIELQNNIIRKILDTKDDQLLDYLDHILSKDPNKDTYLLTDFEQTFIRESLLEYQKGRVISNDDVISKTEKWLEE